MKIQIVKYTGILCLALTLFVFVSYSYNEESSIPLLAGICDVIGVGHVIDTWRDNEKYEEGVVVVFDNYWRGNPRQILFMF